MRIIGGKFKGRALSFPSGSIERPTSDFLRETLFNLLGSLDGKNFLDLYAGSGSVGLEAASRGAREVYFVEKNAKLAAVIQRNIDHCGLSGNYFIAAKDVKQGLRDLENKRYKADIVFADPPYNRGFVSEVLKLLTGCDQILTGEGLIVMQHSVKEMPDVDSRVFCLKDLRKYGENALTFLTMEKK